MANWSVFLREELAIWLMVFSHTCVWFFVAPSLGQQSIGLQLAWQELSQVLLLTTLCLPVVYVCYMHLSRHIFYAQHALVILMLICLELFTQHTFFLLGAGLAGCTAVIAALDMKRSTSGAKQYMRVARLGLAYTGVAAAYVLSATVRDPQLRIQSVLMGFVVFNLVSLALLPRNLQVSPPNKQVGTLLQLVRSPSLWFFAFLGVLVFGGSVALLVWLPSYVSHVYDMGLSEGLIITAMLIACVALMRLIGGWFIQLYSARALHWLVSWVALGCVFIICYPPTTMTIHGIDKIVSLHLEVPFAAFLVILVVLFSALGFAHAALYEGIEVRFKRDSDHALVLIDAITMVGTCGLIALFAWVSEITGIYSSVFMAFYGLLVLQMMLMYLSEQKYLRNKAYKNAVRDNFLNK